MNGFEYRRIKAGLRQKEVAEAMKVSQGAVSAWESGRSYPVGEKLPMLARLYGCTINDLYTGAESQHKAQKRSKEDEIREFEFKHGLGG